MEASGSRRVVLDEGRLDWGEVSVLERLKYDLTREKKSSQLAWVRSRLVKLQVHVRAQARTAQIHLAAHEQSRTA